MITRGYLIGQIVDNLAAIAAQAKLRGRLHLFDIHTHVEVFVSEVLNRVMGINLTNFNTECPNNPGLDLGDEAAGWAFQVTADKSSAKIKATLEKIDDIQRTKFTNIRVFVIGEKQGSYSFSGEPYASFGFTEGMVWDFNDVCARIMSLKIEALTDLAEYVTRESRRVRIELEIPDEQGNFSTSINHLIEALPQPKLSDAAKLAEHFHSDNPRIDRIELEGAIKQLSHRLAKLPRLTREVFKLLVERRDEHTVGACEHFRISDPRLRRIYRGDDLDGDLSLLTEAGLVSFDEPDEGGQPYYWTLHFPAADTGFHLLFVEYANSRNLGLHKPLVALDFSDF
ncbi:SMEK domain-containing protein [Stenotrophomonas pavanii]|uniref:SMEK domain-containing protein n=1 Tax=Stenotrophomonas pavanii TaxID=487698 RepID=UPI002DBFDDB2|nr:SMEK domain-containing protein [Stenotrophomonas pavanii]MEC4337240.1 SMEK domain-containing protein [Stenotrophomonas pavanii]